MNVITAENLAKCIDHTLIRPNVTRKEVENLCNETKYYNFRAVCVNLSYLPLTYDLLKGTHIRIGATIGFPFGATSTNIKIAEVKEAIGLGANELDAVINIGYLRSGDLDYVRREVVTLVETAKSLGNIAVKVIIEIGYLNENEKVSACMIAKEAKVDFIKTSTGIGTTGATVEDVMLIRKVVGKSVGVKASGGIDSYEKAVRMLNAGADIIGTSHGVTIMNEAMKR